MELTPGAVSPPKAPVKAWRFADACLGRKPIFHWPASSSAISRLADASVAAVSNVRMRCLNIVMARIGVKARFCSVWPFSLERRAQLVPQIRSQSLFNLVWDIVVANFRLQGCRLRSSVVQLSINRCPLTRQTSNFRTKAESNREGRRHASRAPPPLFSIKQCLPIQRMPCYAMPPRPG
jgi:hypothetical protein